jgi:uncharacterized protein YcbX
VRDVPGRLVEIHRFPVKSLSGERLDEVDVDGRGVAGDRLWSVRDPDGKFGSGKSSRRFRKMDGLLALSAAYDGEVPVVTFPGGRVLRGDDPAVNDALSQHVGRPVTLKREGDVSHFDEGPIHVVTTAALRTLGEAHGHAVDARHLRPSFVVDVDGDGAVPEDAWAGRRVRIGEMVLEVGYPMPRCVMLDMPQVDVPAAPGLLRTITAINGGDIGVVAEVLVGGWVRLGDEVEVLPGAPG